MADVKKTAEEQVQYDPQYILQVKDLKKYFPIKGGMLNKTVGYVKRQLQLLQGRYLLHR